MIYKTGWDLKHVELEISRFRDKSAEHAVT